MNWLPGDGHDPARWTGPSSGAPHPALGAAWRRARDATAPRPGDVDRLAARLTAGETTAATRSWKWRLAMAILLLLSMGGAVGAAGLLLRRAHRAAPPAAARPLALMKPMHSDPGRRGPMAVLPEAPADVPPGPVPPASGPVTRAAGPTAALARPRKAVVYPAPVTEAGLLATAFRALRAHSDAAAALRTLDEYDRAFPDGALSSEARVARVDALMIQGRRSEALSVLETFDGAPTSPPRNVLLLRGELLAETGRCSRAERDFDEVIRAGIRGDAEARALFGRGACRLNTGDSAAGRADLQRYLGWYPGGSFAQAAREGLRPGP